MKKILLWIVVAFVPVFGGKLIDLVTVSGYARDGVMKVNVYYKSTSTDEYIWWDSGKAWVTCTLFELRGNILNPRKGAMIGGIRDKEVHRARQAVYFDIKNTRYEYGLLDCTITTSWARFHSTDDRILLK